MCRIDGCFNFLFKFTATLSKLRSKSRRGSFGTYEFGGSISRRIFSIISHWNRCQICCGCQQSKLWIWGKYFSLISIIFVDDETSDQPTIHLWGGLFFELLHKNHQRLDNFAAFLHIYSTYLSYSLNGISQYVSFEEFSFFYSGVEHIKTIQRSPQYPPLTQCQCLHPLHPSPPQTQPPRSHHRCYLPPHERSKSQWWSWCSCMF